MIEDERNKITPRRNTGVEWPEEATKIHNNSCEMQKLYSIM
jgi:hypothetical protein